MAKCNRLKQLRKLIAVLLFFVGSANSAVSAGEFPARVEMPLSRYSFERTAFNDRDMPYLMGNGEMGGLADLKGLGFERLWFANLWSDAEARRPLPGLLLIPVGVSKVPDTALSFSSRLDIETGILSTRLSSPDFGAYESRSFFAKFDSNLLVYSITNTSMHSSLKWRVGIPDQGFTVTRQKGRLTGTERTPGFTPIAWSLRHDVFLSSDLSFSLAPGETATFLFSVSFDPAVDLRGATPDMDALVQQQERAWKRQWRSIASVILPDGDYARWFYRSIYTLYATAGSKQYLPGEEQFSNPDPDWKMHAFTYGYGGWGAMAFMALGDKRHARRMLDWHYKPKALRDNVALLFKQGPVDVVYNGEAKGQHIYLDAPNPDAIAFGHELTVDGRNITYPGSKHWDKQRSLDAFAAAMFHRYNSLYPDERYKREVVYPVFKGTAELWRSLAKRDAARGAYVLPPLLSVAENIMEPSVLDAVLAARWNLAMAARYANELGADAELATQWQQLSDQILIPQNASTYLEYLDDTGTRKGGGYFGIRAAMYLGYPLTESIAKLDDGKVRRTLDLTWARNDEGRGMITFIANWFALTESHLGNGDLAYAKSSHFLDTLDPSGAAVCEAETVKNGATQCINPYFLTGYASFILTPISMMLQSDGGKPSAFPAMPTHWKDAAFYDLPAAGGLVVSAKLKDGNTVGVRVSRKADGRP